MLSARCEAVNEMPAVYLFQKIKLHRNDFLKHQDRQFITHPQGQQLHLVRSEVILCMSVPLLSWGQLKKTATVATVS